MGWRAWFGLAAALGFVANLVSAVAAEVPEPVWAFLDAHCVECHDPDTEEGGLDLYSLRFEPDERRNFDRWVLIHDRVNAGEMPPEDEPRPGAASISAFLAAVANPLETAEKERLAREGRAVFRRLNRYEYEYTLQDLFGAPWLEVSDLLPADGTVDHFSKSGEALDISFVQLGRLLEAANHALHSVMAPRSKRPETAPRRYWARNQRTFGSKLNFNEFNRAPERATFVLLDDEADLPVLRGEAPISVNGTDPEKREREAIGVVASSYEPLEPRFDIFRATRPGRYRIRLSAYTFWAGPESKEEWWIPSRKDLSKGRTVEPVTIYAQKPPRLVRRLGAIDVDPEPGVYELEVLLQEGETIRPDASRLFRSRPPYPWKNPLATPEGQPGVAYRWLEVEGPLEERWPPEGHDLLFGDLAIRDQPGPAGVYVISSRPKADAERLLRRFMDRAYRRPVREEEVESCLEVIDRALDAGSHFEEALLAGYAAVLCSPGFLSLEEQPGELDAYALGSRLSYFLWSSEPDERLRALAASGDLREPEVLRAETERMIEDPKASRFVMRFLDSWLDLAQIQATTPDPRLYPDYYLDDWLVESALLETRAFFAEVLRDDLPSRTLIDADFAMVNQRLARHYDLPPVKGGALRRVELPPGHPRGGLMTQASVLKVTANGTTTSPVHRGVWVMERLVGKPPPPPPPGIPAIEPDTRGAETVREQLMKHREVKSCDACHAKIDPAGFALEAFDVLGGWRDRYRALDPAGHTVVPAGFGKNGQAFRFHHGHAVDSSAEWLDGSRFEDIEGLKRILLDDERQIARNLAKQLVAYGTGAPVGFVERARLEALLDSVEASGYGVRSLVHAVVQSDFFRRK